MLCFVANLVPNFLHIHEIESQISNRFQRGTAFLRILHFEIVISNNASTRTDSKS